jgi:hypothetical protein
LIQESPAQAWTKFADMSYRLHNMAGYYLIGVICSVITLAVFSVVIGEKPLPKWANILMPMGYSSLFSYTFGNCLLNLFGGISTQMPSLVFLVLFFSLVLVTTTVLKQLPFYTTVHSFLNFRFKNN